MLGTANAGGLVAGGGNSPPDDLVAVRVLRAFLWNGQRQEVGTILPGIPRRRVVEMLHWGKAEIAEAVPAAAEPAQDPETEKDPAE